MSAAETGVRIPPQFYRSPKRERFWEEYVFVGQPSEDKVVHADELKRTIQLSKLNLAERKFGNLRPVEYIPHHLPTFEETFIDWRLQREDLDKRPLKTLIINAPDDEDTVATANKGDYPPLNLWRVGTWAKHFAGADVKLADGTIMSIDEIKEMIVREKPDVLGVSVLVSSVKSAMELSAFAKDQAGSIVVWGNDHPSQNIRESLRGREMVDVIMRGDGADRWYAELLLALKNDTMEVPPSTSYRTKNGIYTSPHLVYDMDDTPIVDISLIPPEIYLIYVKKFREKWSYWFGEDVVPAIVNFARGCHWGTARCSYCDINDLEPRAMMDFDRIWKEIRLLKDTYGVNLIWEVADNFTSFVRPKGEIFGQQMGAETGQGKSWIERLLEARPDDLKDIKWFVYGRADDIIRGTKEDPKYVIQVLKKLGVVRLDIGLDHFDDRILLNGKSINKGSTGDANFKAIELMTEEEIQGHFSFVFGAPGETRETLFTMAAGILYTIDTMIDRNGKTLIGTFDIGPFMPWKGNAVYNMFYDHKDPSIREEFRRRFGDADTADQEAMTAYTIEHTTEVTFDQSRRFTDWVYELCAENGIVPGGVGLPAEVDETGQKHLKNYEFVPEDNVVTFVRAKSTKTRGILERYKDDPRLKQLGFGGYQLLAA